MVQHLLARGVPDGPAQVLVLAHLRAQVGVGRAQLTQAESGLDDESAHRADESRAARALDERLVEGLVGIGDPRAVARAGSGLHLPHRWPQRAPGLPAVPFEEHLGGAALDRRASAVDVGHVLDRQLGDEDPTVGDGHEDALRDQALHGLAKGAPRDLETVGQVRLPELRPGRQGPRDDGGAQLGRDVLDGRASWCRGDLEVRHHALPPAPPVSSLRPPPAASAMAKSAPRVRPGGGIPSGGAVPVGPPSPPP